MCSLCDSAHPGERSRSRPLSRRDFIRTAALAGTAATVGPALLDAPPASAQAIAPPVDSGTVGRRYLIRGGAVLSMDPAVGDFAEADVLVEGRRIAAVGSNVDAGDAQVVDARGMIVMPGFIDTHHHEFETALRSFLADGLLFNDGQPHGAINYFDFILGKFAPAYRPQDVHINILFGSLSQLDAGVTSVLDVSQIHHSPEHTDAAVKGLADSGRRAVLGYFEGSGNASRYPDDARRVMKEHFSSEDQLLTMMMGGELYLPGYEASWRIGRELGIPIAAHVFGNFGIPKAVDERIQAKALGPDLHFIHMTLMSDEHWRAIADAGATVSIAVPIEMTMRHGMPPILKAMEMNVEPSLSTDVECTMTADFFTQMRSMMTLQRALVNERALAGEKNLPKLLTSRDVIRFATVEGARHLRLDRKIGTLTPGKEADIVLLDAGAINVAPLNHVPGAVVTLMERSNVDTVIVAGKVRKWKGRLLDVDLPKLRRELEASRDHLFQAAKIDPDLFRT
ncbi:amidohydrolase family protein [Arenibaculum pallidiluteum]|uniref:amidohydrolase family protein n=1 Tax=Arenibaculum pallidiluteum TaxID=2812559 RepID=UPI001A96F547|nr:amidohydrolase family protein [Arenibaculum pallidiluteum]